MFDPHGNIRIMVGMALLIIALMMWWFWG